MDFKEHRKKVGKTVADIAKESGLSYERLLAIDEKRRGVTQEEAVVLSPYLRVSAIEIIEGSTPPRKEADILCRYIRELGYFYGASEMGEKEIQAFVHLLNDLWSLVSVCGWSDSDDPEVNATKMKKELRRRLAFQHLKRPYFMDAFLFTINNSNNEPSACWVEMYEGKNFKDGIHTVVLESVQGTAVTNDPRAYIDAITKEFLIPMGWENSPRVGKKREDVVSSVRFIVRDFWFDGQENYTRLTKHIPFSKENASVFNRMPSIERRDYRRVVRAKELPHPFQDGSEDFRCRHDKTGKCPMETEVCPDAENGCAYCRGIADGWRARQWLLEKLTDTEIRQYVELNDLKENHPDIFNDFLSEFIDGKLSDADRFYDFVYRLGSYDNTVPIVVNNRGYTDGRHRVKIAQNLKLTIPIIWPATEYMEEELID